MADRIEAVARTSAAVRGASWGAKVVNLDSGETVYERNADHFFIPASNAKLFTSALALQRLGPDHRFLTLVLADEMPDAGGVLHGDLRLVGGGDPTLSAREIPYRKGPVRGDPLAAIEELAEQVVARGLRRLDGDVVGDDSAYVWEPYPTGWAQEDIAHEYGAPVSALTLHDNAFRLSVLPAKQTGAPARLLLRPPVEYYLIHNHVKTVSSSETRVSVDWPAASREMHVWGTIRRNDGRAKLLAVRDPAHYAAWVFADALRRRGVAIRGHVRAKHLRMHEVANFTRAEEAPPVGGVELARRTSAPLFEILRIVNKVSQNLHAELILREVGRVRRNIGSRAAGLAELRDFLAEAGVERRQYHFEDASGLSSQNLVTPSAVTELLTYMYLSVDRDGWLELLPVGGEDGTLGYRFRGAATAGRVLAKTGTLTHACALSGYAEPRTGGRLAFSILVNNYNASNSAVRRFIDKVVLAFLE